jgi:hypothetical protein
MKQGALGGVVYFECGTSRIGAKRFECRMSRIGAEDRGGSLYKGN